MRRTTKINPQLALVAGGIILFSVLFIFGRTVPKKDKPVETQHVDAGAFSFSALMTGLKKDLKPYQLTYLTGLENSVTRGNVKDQQIHMYHQLASFWRDSIPVPEVSAYYAGEAAKLENSEKSLTFAAHLLTSRLMQVENSPGFQNWLATNAKVLFERALQINPSNDSSKIGLGACFIFGNISDNPMQGIQPITEITRRDPGNVYAQKILALGGIKSGQFDKAIERLKIVLDKEPGNMEMIFRLAEAYERKGDKVNAIAQYRKLKELVPYEEVKAEIQQRIDNLNK